MGVRARLSVALVVMSDEYSLYQANVFEYLKNGQSIGTTVVGGEEWFVCALVEAFGAVAESYSCKLGLSFQRLSEVRALWIADVSRLRVEDDGGPDHFKQAGYLAYWLRRRLIISAVTEAEAPRGTPAQQFFLKYSNEVCAFLVGFRLSVVFETKLKPGSEREDQINCIRLDTPYFRDVVALLHHKSVSPQAMYFIYRSLFYRLNLPRDGDGLHHFTPRLIGS